MKTHDYITAKTLERIGPSNYEKLRQYLRFCGYTIKDSLGNWFKQSSVLSDWHVVILSNHGNLKIFYESFAKNNGGKELSYNEVMRMVNLLP